MPALSRILSSTVEKLLFDPVTITGVEDVGERFRLLRMQGAGFEGVRWIPGQAGSIQTVRKGLKQAGVSLSGSKVKAYWCLGKAGLD